MSYSVDIKNFFNYIISFYQLDISINQINVFILGDVTEEVIFSYLVYLNKIKGNTAKTRNRVITSLKCFYKWLYKKYPKTLKNKENPTNDLLAAPVPKRIPKYLTLEESKSILDIFNKDNSKNYTRDNMIIALFLNCGLRLSELIGINTKDIDILNSYIRIIGKCNKERIVYLNKRTLIRLKTYLKKREKIKTDSEALFLNSKNLRINKLQVERICSKAFKLANIDNKGYTAHSLRHTLATILYQKTNDLLVVKEILGHSTIISTTIYTHVSNLNLKKAVQSNPLNNI